MLILDSAIPKFDYASAIPLAGSLLQQAQDLEPCTDNSQGHASALPQ
jgi:hypothetical protein